MKKILLITHGKLAEGLSSALELIIGKQNSVYFINSYVEDVVLEDEVNKFMASITKDDKLIVMTDLFGGSVNQLMMNKLKLDQDILITGTNLAVLLELALTSEENLSDETVQAIIENGRNDLQRVKVKQDFEDDFNF